MADFHSLRIVKSFAECSTAEKQATPVEFKLQGRSR